MLPTLWRKLLGDIRVNWRRVLAVWTVVILGTTFYGATYPAAINMGASFERTYAQLGYMDFQIQFQSAGAEVLEPLRQLEAVAAVEGRLVTDVQAQLPGTDASVVTLRLVSIPDGAHGASINRCQLSHGAPIRSEDGLWLHQGFAQHHGVAPGDTVTITVFGETYRFTVAGLVFNPEYLVLGRSPSQATPAPSSFGVAWLPYSVLADMLAREGEFNEVLVRMKQGFTGSHAHMLETIRSTLGTYFEASDQVTIYPADETASGGIIASQLHGMFPFLGVFSASFLIGASMITGILLARLVNSERQLIGTLRAMGVTRQELVAHYTGFGLIIGLSGSLAGSLLGYLNSFWVMDAYLSRIVHGELPGYVNEPQLSFILVGIGVMVAIAILAGAVPAWVESATPPGVALRPATPEAPNAIARISFDFLPLSLRLPLRNLLRIPARSVGTALGMTAGATMIFAALVSWDSLNQGFEEFLGSYAFDLRVDMNRVLLADQLEERLRQIDGVRSVQGALLAPATVVQTEGPEIETLIIAADETDPFLTLTSVGGAPPFSRADGVWIGHNLARDLGIQPETIADGLEAPILTVRALKQVHSAPILGVVSQVMGNSVFVPRGLLRRWSPGNLEPSNSALVRVMPGQDAATIEALLKVPGVRVVESMAVYTSDLNTYLDFFRVGILICGVFGLILTLAVLGNAVGVVLHERQEELAVMRSLGYGPGEIALNVTLEQLPLVLVGSGAGVWLGQTIGLRLNQAYDTHFFGMPFHLEPSSYLLGLGSLLLIVLLAELPGLRAVQRVDLGRVSKSQSI